MTLDQLSELLENMTEEQLKFDFIVHVNGEWVRPSMITFVGKDHEDEGFVTGQPIII